MRRLHKLLHLPWRDRFLFVLAVVVLNSIRFGLWILPFRRLLKLISAIESQSIHASGSSVSDRQPPLERLVWSVNAATRYAPGGAKCLARALTLQVLMRRYHYSPELKIGVVKGQSGLEAHAWIEYQGRVVIGNISGLSRFIPLPSFEGVKL